MIAFRNIRPIAWIIVGILLLSACSALPNANAANSVLSAAAPTEVVPTVAPLSYGQLGRVQLSDNWSGYLADVNSLRRQRGTVSDVKGQWVVPTVTCSSAARASDSYSAVWVGIDGSTDGTVEQVGTGQDCVKGQPTYYAWFEIFPRPSQNLSTFSVEAGDTVNAEVKFIGNGMFSLTLQDVTSGQNFTIKRADAVARRQSAEWIVEAPASQSKKVLPLANFSVVEIQQASVTINGQTSAIGSGQWRHTALVMANITGNVQAYPSPLDADGATFRVKWVS